MLKKTGCNQTVDINQNTIQVTKSKNIQSSVNWTTAQDRTGKQQVISKILITVNIRLDRVTVDASQPYSK